MSRSKRHSPQRHSPSVTLQVSCSKHVALKTSRSKLLAQSVSLKVSRSKNLAKRVLLKGSCSKRLAQRVLLKAFCSEQRSKWLSERKATLKA